MCTFEQISDPKVSSPFSGSNGQTLMRLFHFSDVTNINLFVPRPVKNAVERPAGQSWLNGPLVWAIDEAHCHLYFFPRECPRILIWPTPETTRRDQHEWFGASTHSAIAYIEKGWFEKLTRSVLIQYELPTTSFNAVGDVGMWVSSFEVKPNGKKTLTNLPQLLSIKNIELRAIDDLTDVRQVWKTSLHASGIRLRNAKNWPLPD